MSIILTHDNSALQKKTLNLFQQADYRWQQGKQLQEKEEGFQIYTEALNNLNLWISRENNGDKKENLRKIYQGRYNEYQENKNLLKSMREKISNPQASQIKTGGGGGSGNEEKKMRQEAQGAILKEKPNVKWSDISGLDQAKKALQQAVILPMKFPHLFQGARKPWRGILLYGPPGTGKTLLAQACATEADSTFIPLSCADIVSQYVGDSQKKIKEIFAVARDNKPAIIFIDEIDSIAGARGDGENEASRRLKTQILTQMQGVGNDMDGVLVLGATNLPWAIDSAIRRRFERRIYIPLPQKIARVGMLKHNLGKTPHNLTDKDFQKFGQITDGYSGSDMSIVVRDACFEPIRELQSSTEFIQYVKDGKQKVSPKPYGYKGPTKNLSYLDINSEQLELRTVESRDFEKALSKSKPSVSKDQLKQYQVFTKQFGQQG